MLKPFRDLCIRHARIHGADVLREGLKCFPQLRGNIFDQGGPHEAGGNVDNVDPQRVELGADNTAEANNAMLGGGVGGGTDKRHIPGDAGNINDPALGLDEEREAELGHDEEGNEVDIEHSLLLVDLSPVKIGPNLNPCVVHKATASTRVTREVSQQPGEHAN